MEISIAGQILIGLAVILFGGWVLWVSNLTVKNQNSITGMQESNNNVDADLTNITNQITIAVDSIKADFKEFKTEVRADITQMSNTLSTFTKTETDVLKELLKRHRE